MIVMEIFVNWFIIFELFFKQTIAASKLHAYGIQTLKESMNKQNYDLGLDLVYKYWIKNSTLCLAQYLIRYFKDFKFYFQPNLGRSSPQPVVASRGGERSVYSTKVESLHSVVHRNIHIATTATRAQNKCCFPHIDNGNIIVSLYIGINSLNTVMLYIELYVYLMFCVNIRTLKSRC